MASKNQYYKQISLHLKRIMSDSGISKFPGGFIITEGEEEGSYYLKSGGNSSEIEKELNSSIKDKFLNNFNQYLLSNKNFKVLYSNDHNLHDYFFSKLTEKLYVAEDLIKNDDDFDPFSNDSTMAPIEYIKKILEPFKEIIPTFSPLLENIPRDCQEIEIFSYILAFHNEKFWNNQSEMFIQQSIHNEAKSIVRYLGSEDDKFLKEEFKKYLIGKQHLFNRIESRSFEKLIFTTLKNAVKSEHWSDISSCLPTLNKPIEDTSLMYLNENPVYCFNLNRSSIFDNCITISTDKELSVAFKAINQSINKHKPDDVEFININENNLQLIISGEEMTKDYAMGIKRVFEKMMFEYDKPNIVKENFLNNVDEKMNKEYLDKAAETYWLDIELAKPNDFKPQKKQKI